VFEPIIKLGVGDFFKTGNRGIMTASNKKRFLLRILDLKLNPDAQGEDVHGQQDDGAGDVLASHGWNRDVGAARRWFGRCSALSSGAALTCCSLPTRSSNRPNEK